MLFATLPKGRLQTVVEDLDVGNPVIRRHYGNGFIKQYVRDRFVLRTEPATNNVIDYGVKKPSRICLNSARRWHPSPTTIWTFSKTSWRPSWIAVSRGNWPNP